MDQDEQKQVDAPPATKASKVTAEDIEKLTKGMRAVHKDLKEKSTIKKKQLMCIYFFCSRCYRDWSEDMFVPVLPACKCGNQKPRVTAIEKVDYAQTF